MPAPSALAVSPLALVKQRLPTMIESLPGRESARKRFQQAAVAVCMNPSVSTCDAASVASAIYTCARLNLIPDPALQLAAVVPFRDGKAGVRRATLIIMYKGLIELARRADPSIYLKVGTVYANDQYELVEGTEDKLIIRKRWWEIGKEESGEAKFSYCVSRQTGGSNLLVVVSRQEGLAIANASKAGCRPGTPWHDHEDRMREKTTIKRAARLWSLDPERDDSRRLREAIDVDDNADGATVPGTDILGDLGIDEATPDEIPTGASRIGSVAREVAADVRPVQPPEAPADFPADADELTANQAAGPTAEMMLESLAEAWAQKRGLPMDAARQAVTLLLKARLKIEPSGLTSELTQTVLARLSEGKIKWADYENPKTQG